MGSRDWATLHSLSPSTGQEQVTMGQGLCAQSRELPSLQGPSGLPCPTICE